MADIETKYPISMRILHWLMSIAIIGMIFAGWFMKGLANEVPYKWDLYKLHKSFGVCLFVLVFIRIFIRFVSSGNFPQLPDNFPTYVKIGSVVVHRLLYLFMIAIPLTGILMSYYGGYGVPFFNYNLPVLLEVNKPVGAVMNELHGLFAYIMLAVILLHFAGALKHVLVDKFNILKRMI